MELIENEQNSVSTNPNQTDGMDFINGQQNLIVNEQAKKNLESAAKWCKFLAIFACIGIGFILIFGFLLIIGIKYAAKIPYSSLLGVTYLILAFIMAYPTVKMLTFANKSRQAIANNDSQILAYAFNALRQNLKFYGIFVIIYLAFLALALSGFILAAIFA